MTQRERMESGMLYNPGDEAILSEQNQYHDKLHEYNTLGPEQGERRQRLLKEMLGSVGDNTYIQAPFYANWGGKHVHIGKQGYINFNLTMVDDGNIYIGDYVLIGPNVTIATAGHPIQPDLRRKGLQYNADVRIGNNVWIGAGALILPGVTIGDDTVIGAGSVVTGDIPSGVVAVGNPCKVMRSIEDRDRNYYFRDRVVDLEIPEGEAAMTKDHKIKEEGVIDMSDDLMKMMQNRRSVRTYTGEHVGKEKLEKILQAGLLAPSGRAVRPWELIVVQDKETLMKIAVSRTSGTKMLEQADCAIVVIGDKEKTDVWAEDCSIVMTHMHLMADALGVGSCWVQGRLRKAPDGRTTEECLRELLGYPENFGLEAILSLGMPQTHPEPRAIEDLPAEKIHWGKF